MSLVQCWNKVGNHQEGETVRLEDLPEDLQKVVAFHGHLCPGLLLGYRAANAAAALSRRLEQRQLNYIERTIRKACSTLGR